MDYRRLVKVAFIIVMAQLAIYSAMFYYSSTDNNVSSSKAKLEHNTKDNRGYSAEKKPSFAHINQAIVDIRKLHPAYHKKLTSNDDPHEAQVVPVPDSPSVARPVPIETSPPTPTYRYGNSSFLIQEISYLLKQKLELKTNIPAFAVTNKCPPTIKNTLACVQSNCPQLSPNPEERVRSLISDKTVLSQDQEQLLNSIAAQIPVNDVLLLTATSSNHFLEMQAMFRSLHRVVYPELARRENFSMVVWDLGLTHEQRKQTEACCRCQVVTFPVDKFPGGMRDLHCYMWKPLVIRMTLFRARKFVVWQDASIRYAKFPEQLYKTGMEQGLLLLRKKTGPSVSQRTLPETFTYLGQQSCSLYQYPETASGFGVYKHDPFVLDAVTNTWARCGFQKSCMCPRNPGKSHRCFYGPCHRFDQSALSIITSTLYSNHVYKIILYEHEMNSYFWVDRRDLDGNYFNSTGCL